MPGSFRTRSDSPHPFRLDNAPRSRPKKVKHESIERKLTPQTLDEVDDKPLLDTKPQTLYTADDEV